MPSLMIMPGRYAVCRLPAGAMIPTLPDPGGFVSITRTRDEVSLVCEESHAPEGSRAETGWSLLKVNGPLDFSAVGIVASLASPIADAGISLFVISTFDTDYVLVKEVNLHTAVTALTKAGHTVHPRGTAA